jgi:hypothetical protein
VRSQNPKNRFPKLTQFFKKKRIREMRPVARNNPGGGTSSHLMQWAGDPSKRRGKFGVFPSIAPKKGKELSSDYNDWQKQTEQEAKNKGEFVKVKTKRRARKLAAGAWKQGLDRKEAMQHFKSND